MTPPTPATQALVADLGTLGRGLPSPGPERTTELVEAVLARCGPPARRVVVAPPWLRRPAVRARRLAAVAVVVLVALLAAPPVRAAVAQWFDVVGERVGVRVTPDSRPSPSAAPPPTVRPGGLPAEARTALGGPPSVPAALGDPDGVEVSVDRRVVSMTWSEGPEGTVRLDQWAADLDGVFAKTAPGAQFVDVGGDFGVWFDRPHEVVLLDPDGTTRTESARLAGHTLIWRTSTRTFRLEGDLTLDRALEVARSVHAGNP